MMTEKVKYGFYILMIYLSVTSMQGVSQIDNDSLNNWVESQLGKTSDTIRVYNTAHLSLIIADKENNEAGQIKAYLNLARYHDNYGQLDSAIFYYTILKDVYEVAGNSLAVAETCLELKGLYSSKAAYDESLKQVFEALELYEEFNNQPGIAL